MEAYRRTTDSAGGFAVSLALARSLARLIDDAANEDVALDGIAGLAPADLAQHWEATVEFLKIATAAWPALLKERNRIDPAMRRNGLIRAYAMSLAAARPVAPFIVAGSSGSVKATADLMKVIAALPNGAVVLNGLDRHMSGESWDCLPPSHPQFALKELLIHLGADRSDAGIWISGKTQPPTSRAVYLSEAMRPPETADRWADRTRPGAALIRGGIDGLSVIEAATEREEALAVALAIRETLETPGHTAALVTGDRMLARRVAAELRRWEIEADDSAGMPLAKTEAGALLTLSLEAVLAGASPVALLSLLKHPCVTLGRDRRALLTLVRQLERRVLRPGRVTEGLAETRARIADRGDDGGSALHLEPDDEAAILALLADAEQALAPLETLTHGMHDLGDLAAAHVGVLEALTLDAETGRARIWAGPGGEASFGLLTELREASVHLIHDLSLTDYALMLDATSRTRAVRPQGPRHARVSIWGPLEARLHAADLVILSGLNEGVWPANPADDPWLSRPMRLALGLSAPERRIGLAAHDFATLAAQPRVLLTRSRRKDGAPANPSRFLLRMMALAEDQAIPEGHSLELARALDAAETVTPASRPVPRPPVTARPRSLSVTRIERLLRDPYAIYAQYVLGLKPLELLEQPLDARDRGMMIHKAVELFAMLPPERASGDTYTDLLACGAQAFGDRMDEPDVSAFWWPRFERAARWLAGREAEWAATRTGSVIERRGALEIAALKFKLTGTPDRIDRTVSGGLRIIDYKTGAAPTKKQAETFLAPQLPLLAIMARDGAFGPDVEAPADALVYAQISGGRTPGKLTALDNVADLIAGVEAKLHGLIRKYDDVETPYQSRTGMQSTRDEGDYDHLARFSEWGEQAEGEEA